ncbi:MAG TPA: PilZ domain-containing protein [Spirochaetota bacterium]|nr:PilZ domain-containing protein [Spirochaetota bacterium]HOM38955.1 PilZ domain-containing protein [Spirochaetota bacterium]HPQ49213.1 PilZ domain-containing protein [Spirochaetota bacterium]
MKKVAIIFYLGLLLVCVKIFSITPQELSQQFSRSGSKVKISFESILIFIFLVIITFFIVKLLYMIKRMRIYKKDKEVFLKMAEERNMTYHQIKILETLSKKYNVFLTNILTNKKIFNELVVKEKKYLASKYTPKSKIYLDFYSNIEYVNSVFYKRKPAPGEIIHSSRDIHIGTKMIIYSRGKNPNPARGIIVYMDNNLFILQVEKSRTELEPLISKGEVFIFFTHQNDASYEFGTSIIDTKEVISKESVKTNIYLAHSDNLVRKQRRKYIRVRTNISGVITEEIFEDTKVPTSINVNIIDISEGGACITSSEPIKKDTIITISFYLEKMINITAKILSLRPNENKYIIHLEFVNIDENSKYIIRKFVNENTSRRV